jgi:hypothetical protein
LLTLPLTPRGELGPRGEICPLGGMFTPSFTPQGGTLYCLEESRGIQRISPPGDNFTPRGQSSPLGAKFTPRGEVKNGPQGWRLALILKPAECLRVTLVVSLHVSNCVGKLYILLRQWREFRGRIICSQLVTTGNKWLMFRNDLYIQRCIDKKDT